MSILCISISSLMPVKWKVKSSQWSRISTMVYIDHCQAMLKLFSRWWWSCWCLDKWRNWKYNDRYVGLQRMGQRQRHCWPRNVINFFPYQFNSHSIAPITAHVAFEKAAFYYGMRVTWIPVSMETGTCDPAEVKAAISKDTVCVAYFYDTFIL